MGALSLLILTQFAAFASAARRPAHSRTFLALVISTIHEYFVFEYLEALFLSQVILLEIEIVLFEIQHIRDGRLPIPIAEHEFVAEVH